MECLVYVACVWRRGLHGVLFHEFGLAEREVKGMREPSSFPITLYSAEYEVVNHRRQYLTHWRDRPDDYWLARLMQEVGELASSLVGDHDDPPEHELRQIAGICINWLEKRLAASRALGASEKECE